MMDMYLFLTLVIIFTLFAAAVIFYLCLIYPFWAVIHCIASQRTKTKKVLWVLAIVFMPSLGALIYGIIDKKDDSFKNATLTAFILTVLFLIVQIIFIFTAPKVYLPLIEHERSVFGSSDLSELNQDQRDEIRSYFYFFENYYKRRPFNLLKFKRVNGLHDKMQAVLKDKYISLKEYSDLNNLFLQSKAYGYFVSKHNEERKQAKALKQKEDQFKLEEERSKPELLNERDKDLAFGSEAKGADAKTSRDEEIEALLDDSI